MIKRKDYEERIEQLQHELVAMARWLQAQRQARGGDFEGRDTAGKGGAINAIAEYMSPRQCHVVALPKPSEREASQWYFQRYIAHLPAAGEIVLFDRSWYNRAGVEKVMGFADAAQVKTFLKQAPAFEKLLVDDGILLFKYWLCCDQEAAGATLRRAAAGSAQALEAVADRCRGAQALRRLHPRARGNAQGHTYEACTLDAGRLQRPEARSSRSDPTSA